MYMCNHHVVTGKQNITIEAFIMNLSKYKYILSFTGIVTGALEVNWNVLVHDTELST